jgi:autotransporter-associated beta strand protein
LVDASSATTDNVGLLIGGAFTVGRNITVNSNNSSGTTTIGGNNAAATTALFTGTTTLNRGVTLVATTAGATTNFAGPITDGAGSFAVTTSGSGIVKLSASNSYHGGTTVSSGELLADNANGSATGSGAVTVLVSGSIGGSGSIAGALTINGALAPGDGGAGTLTINNTVALGNNASLLFDLDKPGVVAGTGSNDLLSILGTNGSNGGLTIGTGVTLGVTTGVDFSTGIYHLITYTGSLTDNSSAFTGWSIIGLPTGDTGSFSIGSNSIDLTVTSIPEPGTWGTLFAGFGMLIGFQCTRRRKS